METRFHLCGVILSEDGAATDESKELLGFHQGARSFERARLQSCRTAPFIVVIPRGFSLEGSAVMS